MQHTGQELLWGILWPMLGRGWEWSIKQPHWGLYYGFLVQRSTKLITLRMWGLSRAAAHGEDRQDVTLCPILLHPQLWPTPREALNKIINFLSTAAFTPHPGCHSHMGLCATEDFWRRERCWCFFPLQFPSRANLAIVNLQKTTTNTVTGSREAILPLYSLRLYLPFRAEYAAMRHLDFNMGKQKQQLIRTAANRCRSKEASCLLQVQNTSQAKSLSQRSYRSCRNPSIPD